MKQYNEIHESTYFDSVTLMLISSKLGNLDGVKEAAVMMGTDHNKRLMIQSGVLSPETAEHVRPNDMVVGILAESDDVISTALSRLEELMNEKDQSSDEHVDIVHSVDAVRNVLPGANFCIVSLPGKYAGRETMRAMRQGMNVLLFSDNIDLDTEIRLKDYALEHGLLMMGPDCGTAIVNGVALGFANRVRRGNIGLVAAAGTGLQEVTTLIHRMGGGVSQALGTGGRDGKSSVGGRMLLQCLDALAQDGGTEYIGIISKPLAPDVLTRLEAAISKIHKPVVACFLGAPAPEDKIGSLTARTLEDTAALLCSLALKIPVPALLQKLGQVQVSAVPHFSPAQKYLRGLYSGGTLCYETMLLLQEKNIHTYSNIAIDPVLQLPDVEKSLAHTLIDMGDDYFTNGMPHPMIDSRLRAERIVREACDPETAVILLDCVLGYGSNPDPAGELARAIRRANSARSAAGQVVYIASICGTDEDIQHRQAQIGLLEDTNVIVLDSNAQAARYAADLVLQAIGGNNI